MKDKDLHNLNMLIEYCQIIDELLAEYDYSFELYKSKKSFQLSTSMCIIQLGEYVNRLSDEFKEEHNHIPWKKIKGTRNFTTHQYHGINHRIMWKTLTVKIPELKEELELLL